MMILIVFGHDNDSVLLVLNYTAVGPMHLVCLDQVLDVPLGTMDPKDKEVCGSCFQKPYPFTNLAFLINEVTS